MILLDTDVLIEIFDKDSETGKKAYLKVAESGEEFATTVINLHELLYGLIKYKKQTEHVTALPICDYTKTDAALSAGLEYEAESMGKKTMRTDAMIAAIAINNGAALYTNNTKHFEAFQNFGLKLLK